MKMMTRRTLLLAGTALAGSFAAPTSQALMFMRGGGASSRGPAPPTQLATLTLVNTSGSTVASGSVTPIFGWAFKEGDIPAAATATGAISGSGSTTLTVSSVSGTIAVGQLIAGGAGSIPANTTVSAVAGSTITMSQASTAALSGGSLIFAGAPQFQVSGTPQPYSWGLQNFYPDGSLCRASFMLRTTVSIAGSGSLSVGVYSGGSAPSPAASRTLSELQGQGIATSVTGAPPTGANLSGTWTASINGGSFQNAASVYMDGAAGRVWRVETEFVQSSAKHGQLYCYHYVAALQDGSGNLLGYRYLADITQPWYDNDTPAKAIRLLTSVETAWTGGSGGTHALQFPHTSRTFTTTASSTTCTAGSNFDWVTGSGGGSVSGAGTGSTENVIPGYITVAGGTMDSAFSANTLYFATVSSASLTTFTVSAANTGAGATPVTANGDATGTMTFNPAPMVEHFGHLYMLSAAAAWQYIQASGSLSADATIRTQYDTNYFHSTGMLPPFNKSLAGTVTDCNALWIGGYPNWSPTGIGPVNQDIGGTGSQWSIGVVTNWHSVHFFNQSQDGEQTVRTIAYAGQNPYLTSVRSNATRNFAVINNNSYAGMPAANNTFQWLTGGSVYSVGFTAPPAANTGFTIYEADNTHKPSWVYYAALVFGTPELIDAAMEQGSQAVANISYGYRNPTAGPGEPLYGLIVNTAGSQKVRSMAWGLRDLIHAAYLVPSNHPDGSAVSKYFLDMANGSADYPITVVSATWLNTYCAAVGLWESANQYSPIATDLTSGASFEGYYFGASMALAAGGRLQNSAAQQFIQAKGGWCAMLVAKFGGYHMYGEVDHSGEAPLYFSDGAWTPIQQDSHWAASVPGGVTTTTWVSSVYAGTSCYFRRPTSTPTNGWTPSDNDVYILDPTATSNPSGFSTDFPYFVRDLITSGGYYYFNLAAAPSSKPDWALNTAYAGNAYIQPTAGNAGSYVYNQVNPSGGTSGGTEPTWPQTVGNTVSDGTCTWECVGTTAVIAPSNSGTLDYGASSGPWSIAANPPAASTGYVLDGDTSAQSYLTNLDTMSAMMGAVMTQLGLTKPAGWSGLRSDSTTRIGAAGTSFTAECNWAMQDTF